MTGLELLEGLSFVDERFIQEAENARLGRSIPWMKWLSVAACLCILIVGAFAFGQMLPQRAKDAFEAAPEAAPEMNDKSEAAVSEECAPEAAEIPVGGQPVASAVLRSQSCGRMALKPSWRKTPICWRPVCRCWSS